jgi:thioesterase domain-containing protein
MRPTFYPTLSADEHVRDFDAVLQTMLATQTAAAGSGPPWRTMQETETATAAGSGVTCVQREQESFAPVDLIGYSMGGSTAKFLKRSNYMYGGHYT